jgi:hypothetical protein
MTGVNYNATMLAEHLHAQAKWREIKADEYPDDDRNDRASDALTAAGNEVAAMSDDDPRLRKMSDAGWFEEGLCTPGEHGREVVRRYGFRAGTVGYLLADLAGAAAREEEDRLGDEVDEFLPDEILGDR